jgi:hypothetical protein
MSNVQTVLLKSADPDVISVVSAALSETEGYHVVFCDTDRAAIRWQEESLIRF